MPHAEIRKELLQKLDELPEEAAREALDFVQFLAQKAAAEKRGKSHPLGLLKGKASCRMAHDFAISDEEFLGS